MVPIPIELMMIPMMIANRARIWVFALATFLGCMTGVAILYLIGWLAFETVGEPLIMRFGYEAQFADFQAFVSREGVLALVIINFTPIPMAVAATGGAAVGMNAAVLMGVIGVIRAFRYFGIGVLVWALGPRAERLLAKAMQSSALGWTALIAAIPVIGTVVWWRLWG